MRVTSRPLTRPKPAVTAMPSRMASGAGMPKSSATLVMTIEPSAMTMPHDRSMPAVRMISVWPMAITPTTMTCCRISAKLAPLKKLSVVSPKMVQAIARAMKGPSWLTGGSLSFKVVTRESLRKRRGEGEKGGRRAARGRAPAAARQEPKGPLARAMEENRKGRCGAASGTARGLGAGADQRRRPSPSDHFLPQHRSTPTLVSLLSTPATGLAAIRVTPVST